MKKNFAHIYLNCRRGMLELDLILINFLEIKYINLTSKLKYEFNNFLKESDQTLYSILIKNEYNKKYKKIIIEIKKSISLIKFN